MLSSWICMRKGTRLVLALDEIDVVKALSVAEKVRDQVDAIKINWPLLLAGGPGMITKLSHLSPVICDFKVADIPNTNRLIAEQAFSLGASGIIVHGFVGHDSVQAVVDAAKGKDVFVVTEMSHPGGKEFTAPAADRLARLALEAKATGVIAPATRPERIAHIRTLIGNMLILSPGVGAQGGSAAEALRHGADFVIVGRSIYEDPDPRAAALRIVNVARDVPYR
jgi:orotidine-5'-phosphate decarboxylase